MNQQVTRAYLREQIGLGLDPAGEAKANAMIAEGLDSLDAFLEFDKDSIKALCASIRKPGGLIVDPNDAARQIQNPGLPIPAIAEGRLITAVYGAKLYERVGRQFFVRTFYDTKHHTHYYYINKANTKPIQPLPANT